MSGRGQGPRPGKGGGNFDADLPAALHQHDFGPGLWHVYRVSSAETDCVLAAFGTGKLQLMRLDPAIEVMQEWIPPSPSGKLLDVFLDAAPGAGDARAVTVCTQGANAKKTVALHVHSLQLDPRKMWLTGVGSTVVSQPKCAPVQISGSPTATTLAVLFDDGSLTITSAPAGPDAAADSYVVDKLDAKTDAQLLAMPSPLGCCLHHYAPDYVFLLHYSRKLHSAVASVYDIRLRTVYSMTQLPGTSDWQQKPVHSTLKDRILTLHVGRGDNVNELPMQVPTGESSLLDVFQAQSRPTDAPVQDFAILDLETALSELGQSKKGNTSVVLPEGLASKAKPMDTAPHTFLESVQSACKSKQWDTIPSLAARSKQFILNETDVPGLLEGLLGCKSDKVPQHVAWYFQCVQRIKAPSLLLGLRFIAKSEPKVHVEAGAAVLIAAAGYNNFAPKLMALGLPEVLAILRYIYKQMQSRVVEMGRAPTAAEDNTPEDVTMVQLISVTSMLIDAHIMDLMAADAEAQQLVTTLYAFCKSYAHWIQSLGELNGTLSALVGDAAATTRPLDSKNLTPGALRAPVRDTAGLTYCRIQPTPGQ
mmetsp:Transcript_2844/g.5041  ORF Transcript_2844/g.5041 Transcript_2844/m.5041 type:complete len:590 (-) Transcript_2844:389-2158(-)